jgi:hypothetical protein
MKIAGAVTASIGVAVAATGIVFAVLAQKAGNDLSALDRAMPKVSFDPAKQSAGKTDQLVGQVLIPVGAAAALVGTLVAVLGRHAGRPHRLAVGPAAIEVRF